MLPQKSCLFVVLASCFACAASLPPISRHLDLSMPELDQYFFAQAYEERFWDTAFLQRAASITHYEQLWPLIRKLRRGEPIAIIGFGSSVMASHGGCFHTSREQLTQRLSLRDLDSTEDLDRVIPEACRRDGYMGYFMRGLNQSFPHEGHVFLNMGRNGRLLGSWTNSFCA